MSEVSPLCAAKHWGDADTTRHCADGRRALGQSLFFNLCETIG
jgi:hypothetical protein